MWSNTKWLKAKPKATWIDFERCLEWDELVQRAELKWIINRMVNNFTRFSKLWSLYDCASIVFMAKYIVLRWSYCFETSERFDDVIVEIAVEVPLLLHTRAHTNTPRLSRTFCQVGLIKDHVIGFTARGAKYSTVISADHCTTQRCEHSPFYSSQLICTLSG